MDLAKRSINNPILRPKDINPSIEGMHIECLLNPGVFQFEGKTFLLLRVAERPLQKEGVCTVPVFNERGEIEILQFKNDDPGLDLSDPRVINYKGQDYLTTLSHLRLVCSDDGVDFYEPEGFPLLTGDGDQESYGIEDCRVTQVEGTYYLTYTAVSPTGVAVGLRTTNDWISFKNHGLIFSAHNKDCTFFEEKINGNFVALHRPSSPELGGNYIWVAKSPDGIHWGEHRCIAQTRKGMWDSARIGAGAAPVLTDKGWLEIYHGADENHRYCLGALLLDRNAPYKVIARSEEPIMEPIMQYEKYGFFGNVIFTNGHLVDGDEITVYYGASDEVICMAKLSIQEILESLKI
ncbi:glycoside hydrolase family 130 protein [Prolixibacteraceae bacterium Z1-6]|uniref:Glycoside hydrolase family 130 protein n=1 Tax=Draconibacterium aestuarii TaxID=2998507 RepID=A0A9X3F7V4_9BACT|nr:glycoside hydrolase family 130 protein [Prolixibacteraceae bacterium Z1-6]